MIKVAVIGEDWLVQALPDKYLIVSIEDADLIIIEDGRLDLSDIPRFTDKTVVSTADVPGTRQVHPTVPLKATSLRSVKGYFRTVNLTLPRKPYIENKNDVPSTKQKSSDIGVITLYSSTETTRKQAYDKCLIALQQQNVQPKFIKAVDTEPCLEYNKSRYTNKAVSELNADKLVLLDSDMILHPTFMKQVQSVWKDGIDWVKLDGRILSLTKIGTDAVSSEKDVWKQCVNKEYIKDSKICPAGVLVLTKQLYESIGGMHEGYAGWGCEDWDFLYKLEEMTKGRVELRIQPTFHMYHTDQPRTEHSSNVKLKNHRLAMPVSKRIALDRIYYEKAYMRNSS